MKDFLKSKTFNIITLVIIITAIPTTVYLSQQQQDIRQQASVKRSCIPRPNCGVNDPNCGLDIPLGGWCPPVVRPTSKVPFPTVTINPGTTRCQISGSCANNNSCPAGFICSGEPFYKCMTMSCRLPI